MAAILRVPVVGIDDTVLASLTTVRIAPDEVATTTLERLLALIDQREQPGSVSHVGSRLIPRGTTRPAPTTTATTKTND